MPKLDATHTIARLIRRLEQLKAGEEVPAKDIRAILSDEQIAELDAAWKEQQDLRKLGRSKSSLWKTKREVQIEILESALKTSKSDVSEVWTQKQVKAKARQLRIYFDAIIAAEEKGKTEIQAENWANNELTRAGLRRMDGKDVSYHSKRDIEIARMEDELRKSLEDDEKDS